MFEAFVFVCAANFAYEVDNSSCVRLSDSWGPYVTQENCDIRTDQMVEDVLRGTLTPLLFEMYSSYGVPADQLYAEGVCIELEGEDA
jgi:hypothetical protein